MITFEGKPRGEKKKNRPKNQLEEKGSEPTGLVGIRAVVAEVVKIMKEVSIHRSTVDFTVGLSVTSSSFPVYQSEYSVNHQIQGSRYLFPQASAKSSRETVAMFSCKAQRSEPISTLAESSHSVR